MLSMAPEPDLLTRPSHRQPDNLRPALVRSDLDELPLKLHARRQLEAAQKLKAAPE